MSKTGPMVGIDEDLALKTILSGTAAQTGEEFFSALVENLAAAMGTHIAWVSEYLEDSRMLKALAFSVGGELIDDIAYSIDGTPCEPVIDGTRLIHVPHGARQKFPQDLALAKRGVESYLGVPLMGLGGEILGHLAVMDTHPMPEEPRALAIFRIFAARGAAELQRMRAESDVRDREEKLSRLFDGAMDAIVELDENLNLVMLNGAAEVLFKLDRQRLSGRNIFADLLDASGYAVFQQLARDLAGGSSKAASLWIPGGMQIRVDSASPLPVEATLSRFETQGKTHFTLILRDINDRLEADRQIQSLTHKTAYLQQELESLTQTKPVIGTSKSMQKVMAEVSQVARTQATVLVLGETGTGKELIARAVHESSPRKDQPLIKVNCGALPESLIESELFGHEKGAFTGATSRREGRFALADGGTIFLDEIGDLAAELQVKLLRVLQEGEFEPLGSSKTRKVDVRVITATNRDLFEATQNGEFREDLYYRLAVFPIILPPLRERSEDMDPLAEAFLKKFAADMGRNAPSLTPENLERLKLHRWPGNIRELQNVIERAFIVADNGPLDFNRALSGPVGSERDDVILSSDEFQELERRNIIRALHKAEGQVSGAGGAAELLGMNASTLSSRIKALNIVKSG